MKKARAVIHMTFSVDLDPVPGFGHQVEDWVSYLRSTLAANGYNRKVEITETKTIPYVLHEGKWTLASEIDTKTLLSIVQQRAQVLRDPTAECTDCQWTGAAGSLRPCGSNPAVRCPVCGGARIVSEELSS
jgi:hypothetical protein